MKVLLCGVLIKDNFGGPSLLYGAEKWIRNIDKEAEIICYTNEKQCKILTEEMQVKIYENPFESTLRFIVAALLYKIGIVPKAKNKKNFLYNIKSSDFVVDLFGICFCSKFSKQKDNKIGAIKSVIGKFSICFVAKIFKVKTIKAPASFGPIDNNVVITQAKYAVKNIFDVVIAREKESYKQIVDLCKEEIKKIYCSPDLANLMPYAKNKNSNKDIIISVSYQILNQWNSKESYITCIVNLINHIIDKTNYNIEILPNEILDSIKYHDIIVAKEIYKKLSSEVKKRVLILDIKHMNGLDIKNVIANCEVMIASRYHSCVASLSAGIPTLVIGWHYKYIELLQLYEQENWILSNYDCSTKKLVSTFDDFWKQRKKLKKTIENCCIKVIDNIFELNQKVFKK